jgi:hypothetical protein
VTTPGPGVTASGTVTGCVPATGTVTQRLGTLRVGLMTEAGPRFGVTASDVSDSEKSWTAQGTTRLLSWHLARHVT